MTDSLLIYNERSGSYSPALVAELEALFAGAGRPIGRTLALGQGDLPTAQEAHAAGLDLIIILSGDGSISAATDALDGWGGTLLILPGGTMNLISHAIHGPLSAPEIVRAWLDGEGTRLRIPMIRANGLTAYAGIVAGPTALWGDVREDMRNLDLASLGESVPRALSATLDESGVRIDGQTDLFPAIYLEPSSDGIQAFGVQAANMGDLLRHGLAWLKGDFREGPSEPLGCHDVLDLTASHGTMDMLVDGERRALEGTLHACSDLSGVHFHAVRGEIVWR
jgi:hypothetical protein